MANQVANQKSSLQRYALVWVVSAITACVFYWDLMGFFILYVFWFWIMLVSGLILIGMAVADIFQKKRFLVPLTTLVVIITFPFFFFKSPVPQWGLWPRFYLAKLYYDY